MNHFHANMIEDTGATKEATSLGTFETRARAQQALLRDAGSISGQPSWTLTSSKMSDTGLDAIEFLHRDGNGTLTLSVWACECSQG